MFGPFERAVAGRYLRARKGERFVSIIAIFSLIGIALGVATLIVVNSVMSGFSSKLMQKLHDKQSDIVIESSDPMVGFDLSADEMMRSSLSLSLSSATWYSAYSAR